MIFDEAKNSIFQSFTEFILLFLISQSPSRFSGTFPRSKTLAATTNSDSRITIRSSRTRRPHPKRPQIHKSMNSIPINDRMPMISITNHQPIRLMISIISEHSTKFAMNPQISCDPRTPSYVLPLSLCSLSIS